MGGWGGGRCLVDRDAGGGRAGGKSDRPDLGELTTADGELADGDDAALVYVQNREVMHYVSFDGYCLRGRGLRITGPAVDCLVQRQWIMGPAGFQGRDRLPQSNREMSATEA